MIVLDLSRSMDAGDLNPSRLARARFKLADVLERRREGRTGLIAYAGRPFLVTPLTSDTATILLQAGSLETGLMPARGSRPDRALKLAGELLERDGGGPGRVLLITDDAGGSAADAQHIASELVGRFQKERPGLPALALTTDSSTLTSVANDYGFDSIFSRQVDALGAKGDALIAISTSGASPNVIEALRSARARGIATIGLLGRDGGAARELCDVALVVDGQKTARIQEVHILIAHVICEHLESEMC